MTGTKVWAWENSFLSTKQAAGAITVPACQWGKAVKNVLIMGGSYFAGRVFVQALASLSQYQVFVLNRGNAPLNENSVTQLTCDRNNPLLLKRTLGNQSFDIVIDFCAYTPDQVTNLFQAISRENFQQYILISTASVYAPTPETPASEDAPKLSGPQPELGPAADYGYDKWRTEYASMAQCRRHGVEYTHLRPCIIYGKFNYAPRESYFFDLIHQGLPVVIPDNDDPRFSFVSVWDVARALIACMDNPPSYGADYNLASPEIIGYSRFVEILSQVMGKEAAIVRKAVNLINAERLPLPFPLDAHLLYSGEKICRELPFEYTPMMEHMQATWDWYLQTQISPKG